MSIDIKVTNLFLLYLSITSLHLISGYAWSGRLEKSTDFSQILLEEGAQDSVEEQNSIEYEEERTTSVAKRGNLQSERKQSGIIRGVLDLNCNRVFDTANETDLQEMYDIQ
jgi:hypothetical protein